MPVASVIYGLKDQFSFVRLQVILFLETKEIRLSSREIDAFVWIILEGWNEKTQEKVRKLGILKGNGINNLGSKLISKNLLVQSKKGVKVLPDDFKIYLDGFLKVGICTNDFLNKLNEKFGKKTE